MSLAVRTIALLFAVQLGVLADDAGPPHTNIATCRTASQSEDYPALLPISNDIKQIIASYRERWRQFCTKDEIVTLDVLFIQAQKVEQEFQVVFRRLWDDAERDPDQDADEIHHALTVTLPSFIPAFLGWYMERAEFRPVLVDFREASTLGTKEDARFFQIYTPLHGDTGVPPWIELTTDYSGCVRFGKYDWVAALKTADDLRKETKSTIYLKLIDQFGSDLLEPLTEKSGETQTCGHGQDVLPDLLTVRNYMRSRDAAATKNIEQTIAAIRAGRITIR